jgi:beta propeller repeat protein
MMQRSQDLRRRHGMKSILSLLLTVSMIAFGSAAAADIRITGIPITTNSYEDALPHIRGDQVVWQGYVGGDWEIFVYNIAMGITTQITRNDHDDLSPQTDGHYVVWQGYNDGAWDIFIWDGAQIDIISDPDADDVSPQISQGRVVWTSEPFGNGFVGHSEIMLYDAEARTRSVLSAGDDPGNTLDDRTPRINSDGVVWSQSDDGDITPLYYDFHTGVVREAWEAFRGMAGGSQKDANLKVLTRHDGHDREVFVYNSESKRYHQITDNGFEDQHPSVSGNYVAWAADGEIYFAELKLLALIGPRDKAVVRAEEIPTFRWETIGYHEFKAVFSKDPGFGPTDVLTLPSAEEIWLSGISFTPSGETWKAIRQLGGESGRAYWRVEGSDGNGDRIFSETRDFVIERTGGASLATSIGDSVTDPTVEGGGSSCFIATAADGQPGGSSSWILPLSLLFSATAVLTSIVLSAGIKLCRHT